MKTHSHEHEAKIAHCVRTHKRFPLFFASKSCFFDLNQNTDDIAGGIREAARLAATYADATTAKVTVLAGKAVGPVYTALAAADLRIAVEGCVVSALEPSAAVSVLYKDEIDASDNIIAATKAKAAAYTAEVCSAANAVACGAADLTCDAANVRASVVAALELLSTKRAARLPKKHGNMAL